MWVVRRLRSTWRPGWRGGITFDACLIQICIEDGGRDRADVWNEHGWILLLLLLLPINTRIHCSIVGRLRQIWWTLGAEGAHSTGAKRATHH